MFTVKCFLELWSVCIYVCVCSVGKVSLSQDLLISLPLDWAALKTQAHRQNNDSKRYISSSANHWWQKHMNKHTAKTDIPSNKTCAPWINAQNTYTPELELRYHGLDLTLSLGLIFFFPSEFWSGSQSHYSDSWSGCSAHYSEFCSWSLSHYSWSPDFRLIIQAYSLRFIFHCLDVHLITQNFDLDLSVFTFSCALDLGLTTPNLFLNLSLMPSEFCSGF